MPQPFLALITPIGSAGGDPPGIWGPGDPRPQPPINLPPGVWPPPSDGKPPPGQGPGGPWVPAHPLPKPPPGMGPGGPWVPAHPLPEPPEGVPPGIWDPSFPTPPIVIPPDPPTDGEKPEHEPVFEKRVGWSPQTGWVVVFVPQVPVVVPSK